MQAISAEWLLLSGTAVQFLDGWKSLFNSALCLLPHDLWRAWGLVLSADGVDPKMGERLLDKRVVRTMKTLMFTCDMYDESGEYACRVGIPSKVVWVRRYYRLCRRMYGHWMLWPRPWHKRQQYWRHLYNGTAVWHIEATCIWCR